jgi:hypothetical protein
MTPFAGRRSASRRAVEWLWPPDKWERLTTVAGLCGDHGYVADIGGRKGELARLLPRSRVVSVNVEHPCDVLVRPGPLPFADRAFDAVASTDVLEHVPAAERSEFLAELLRVARARVVVCFPCGSDAKDSAEQQLARRLRERYDVRMDWLDEHIALGLPRPREVNAAVVEAVQRWAPGASHYWLFSGPLGEGDELLLDAMSARHRGNVPALARVLRGWITRQAPDLDDQQSPASDRAYLVIDVDPGKD